MKNYITIFIVALLFSSCEQKKPIIGYKAGGTGIPVMKKLKEKEPFYQ